MGKTMKYVDEFDFAPAGKTVGDPVRGRMLKDKSSLGIKGNKNPGIKNPAKPIAPEQPMKPAYAKGGNVAGKKGIFEKSTGESYPSRKAMEKHEMAETPTMQRAEVVRKASVRGMPARRGVPVAPMSPLLAMKKGGPVPKAGAYKVPKVMSEFKAGELHSGNKSGPVVKSRKQAMAIALSEARAAGKKK